jgi:hypothetical protein
MGEERLHILKMLQAGQISSEQALQLLDALEEEDALGPVEQEGQILPPVSAPSAPSEGWLYPTVAGAVIMAIGAPLMALGLTGRAAAFWALFCGWFPFLTGLIVLSLGFWSRNARWFHLRIQNSRGAKSSVAISLPLPLTFAAWVLRLLRPYLPQLRETGVDEAILALQEAARSGDKTPVYIEVEDQGGGERVLIWFG